MRTIRVVMLASTLVLASAAYAPVSAAQEGGAAANNDTAAAQSAASYSEQELRSFAGAALEVQRIKDAYTPLLAAAGTDEERQQVILAASHDMIQAVEGQGISVDRFQQILDSAQNDQALVDRINDHLNAR